MGPDESVGNINNNCYMNVACKMVLSAALRCAELVHATRPAVWARIEQEIVLELDPTSSYLLPYKGATAGPSYSLGSLDMLSTFDLPLSSVLLRNTYQHERPMWPKGEFGVGFGTAARAVSAAMFGNRTDAADLFRNSWAPYWLEPFGMVKEVPQGLDGCFVTTFGSMLRSVLLGFTGLRINQGDWRRLSASLPAGWNSVEVDRLWVKRVPTRLRAVHGRPAELIPLGAPMKRTTAAGE
jgi:hypothetical protein